VCVVCFVRCSISVKSNCFCLFFGGGGLYTARARAVCLHPPPPPRLGRAPGSHEPGGPRRRKQSRGPHRSRRQPTPLPGLRCGTRLFVYYCETVSEQRARAAL
jgi:hypothetical protein